MVMSYAFSDIVAWTQIICDIVLKRLDCLDGDGVSVDVALIYSCLVSTAPWWAKSPLVQV